MKTITNEKFSELFTLQPNHIDTEGEGPVPFDGYMYETFGVEIDYILSIVDENRVWTIVEENGETFIMTGYHFVNRIGYLVTVQPYTEEMMFVPGTYEDPDQTLMESLFHVSPSDKDDETGASLEEVILIDFLYHNKELLAKKPLREFIRVYLDEPSKQQ